MDREFSVEEFLFKYRWYLLVAVVGTLLILFGIVSFTRAFPWGGGEKVEILSGEESGEVVVEIAGAVEKPGVYKFQAESRVDDLLINAGGLSADADREWVDKALNRAAKLVDGQKIYIPEKGSTGVQGSVGTIPRQNEGGSVLSGGLVNINSASQAELEALPGIGPVTAQKIIEGRPYSGLEELLTR
ncbi:MAG: helix-hairpin-helix domain-containing protein, partial [Patescibacteria group bacterium]